LNTSSFEIIGKVPEYNAILRADTILLAFARKPCSKTDGLNRHGLV